MTPFHFFASCPFSPSNTAPYFFFILPTSTLPIFPFHSPSDLLFSIPAMGDDGRLHAIDDDDDDASSAHQLSYIDIYPLSNYYFGSKEPLLFKDETLSDRVLRMKSKYPFSLYSVDYTLLFNTFLQFIYFVFFFCSYAAYGLRTCVEAVMLVRSFLTIILFYILPFPQSSVS